SRRPTRGTQQQQVHGQQIAIPSPPQFGQHPGLLRRGNIHYRRSRHRRSSLIAQVFSQPLMYQRVRLCANLLWSDLAITLAFEPVEADTMSTPPRRPDAPLIDHVLVWRIIFVSALMAAGTFGLFFYELSLGTGLDVSRTVAVNAIVFFEVFYLFNTRSLTDSILNRQGLCGNPIVLLGIAAVVVFQVLFTY